MDAVLYDFTRQDASGQVWVGGDSVTCIRGTAAL